MLLRIQQVKFSYIILTGIEMDETARLDVIINDLIRLGYLTLTIDDVSWLCDSVARLVIKEPSLLEITPPVNICGDLHGQFADLIRVFQCHEFTEDVKYLFLGDYVDRGDQSLEVICLLFALKLRFPQNIFLLRGNHESPEMTESFGFEDECLLKLSQSVIPHFHSAFDTLPIAALVGGKIFCVHGGLSPSLTTLDDVRAIKRPCDIPEEGIVADLLWSDPSPSVAMWGPNDRGSTISWGLAVAQKFMDDNGLERIVRAHQMAFGGYDFPFSPNQEVITVFTASCYANRYTNAAAFLEVGEGLEMEFVVLEPLVPEPEEEVRPSTARIGVAEDIDVGTVEVDAQ